MKLKNKYFILIASITLVFCLAIAFDFFPFLRGPAPYPPEWQWAYFFVNTFSKIYLPIFCIALIAGLFFLIETKKFLNQKHSLIILTLLILLSFAFELSILFYSRSGISVLVQRIINPDLNSYFTASLLIHNPIDFLKNYQAEMHHFVYHARSHPPGGIFIFYLLKQLIMPFTPFISFANHIIPSHTDVRKIWNMLLPIDRATALFAAFFLPLLSTFVIVPIFAVAQRLYGKTVAIRSSFLALFIPGIAFFIPINDSFLPLFSVGSFYFLVRGLQDKSILSFFLSGLILFLGFTFNLALLPLLLFFFLFAIFFIKKQNFAIKPFIKHGVSFIVGFFLPIILLYVFFGFNYFQLIQIILKEVTHLHSRSYILWLPYNLLDFFIFVGIPLFIIFLTQIKNLFAIRHLQFAKNIDILFLSFLIMFIILDISGSTRGEAGRIWAIFMPFVLLPAVAYLTNTKKFPTKFFVGIILLQALQILVMQEFWVMLW